MDSLSEAIKKLEAVRQEFGYSIYDQAVKKIARRRLDVDVSQREKRVKFSWGIYKRKYSAQKGICPICGHAMPLIKGQIEMDHINPNAEDFNNDNNLQVTHSKCNRSKGGQSILTVSKTRGRTFLEQIQVGMEE